MRRTKAERSCRMTCCTVRPLREAMRSCKGHNDRERQASIAQVLLSGCHSMLLAAITSPGPMNLTSFFTLF